MFFFKKLATITFLWCVVSSSLAVAQEGAIDWLNANARELSTGAASTDQDLAFLSGILKGKPVVGLGEASHGTQEFYFQKRRIIQYLVSRENYRLIAFESPATFIEPIDKYIQTGEGDPKTMLAAMGLYNAQEIYDLCKWLKAFNETRKPDDRVKMIGFDDEAFWGDPLGRDELMAGKFIKANKDGRLKSILWSHNMHLAKATTMAQYEGMGFHLKKHYSDKYYAVGFDTHSGSVHVLNNGQFEKHDFTGQEGTFSALFSQAKYGAFFIDFNKTPNPLQNAVKPITNIYSNWKEPRVLPMAAGVDFDGLVFIRNTTASKAYNAGTE